MTASEQARADAEWCAWVCADESAAGLGVVCGTRADARADAETLRAFQRDPYAPHMLLHVFGGYETEVGALRCGVSAELWKRGHFYETERALVEDAIFAAQGAFRAVPGLRGDR